MIWAIKHFLWLVVAMCRAGTLGARSGLQPCPLYLIITYTLLLQLFSVLLISFCLFLFCVVCISYLAQCIYTLLLQTIKYFFLSCVLYLIITYTQSPETFRLHFFRTSCLLAALQVTLGGQLQRCQYLEIWRLHWR